MGHLVDIPVCIGGEEFQVYRFPIVQGQHILVPEDLRGFINGFVLYLDQNPLELRVRKRSLALCLCQLGRVELCQLQAKIGEHIVIVIQRRKGIAKGLQVLNEPGLHFILHAKEMCK